MPRSAIRNEPLLRGLQLGAMAGVPLEAGAERYGSLVLGSRATRTHAFDGADRDFLRRVSALVGGSIQRGIHERKLDALAFFDALTGLPNRVLLADRLAQFLRAAKRRHEHFAVHRLDLDCFKAINDEFGHATGDEVLRVAAQRMLQCTRKTDTVARIGGDEFVIVQALDSSGCGADDLAERVPSALSKPTQIAGRPHHIGVSFGISLSPTNDLDADTLLKTADRALLSAKQFG